MLYKLAQNKKKVFLLGLFIFFSGILLFIGSRSALISFILPFFYFIKPSRFLLGFSIFVLVIFSFFFKFKSFQGRLFIWKVCIAQGKFTSFGKGWGSFEKDYPQMQRNYFEIHKVNSTETLLADDARYAFNEPLQIFYEFGFIGLIIFLLILIFLIFIDKREQYQIYKVVVFSLLVNSLFYYTFHENVLLVLFIFSFLNLLLGCYKKIWKDEYSVFLSIFIFVVSSIPVFFLYSQNEINRELRCFNSQIFQDDFSFVNNSVHKTNYCFNDYRINSVMAKAWLKKKDTATAIFIMEEYKKEYQGYDLLLFLGKVYLAKSNFLLAKNNFINASNTIPNRFEPLFLLMQTYKYEGKLDSAKSIANLIIHKPIKIRSSIIEHYLISAKSIQESK